MKKSESVNIFRCCSLWVICPSRVSVYNLKTSRKFTQPLELWGNRGTVESIHEIFVQVSSQAKVVFSFSVLDGKEKSFASYI